MSGNNTANENQLTKKFICFLDKLECEFDYGEGKRGVRLKGFQIDSYTELLENTTIYTFDLDFTDLYYLRSSAGNLYVRNFLDSFISGQMFALITIIEGNGDSYYYPSFSSEEPTYLKIKCISFQNYYEDDSNNSKNLQFILENHIENEESLLLDLNGFGKFKFLAFGVGQGMCSLVYNETNKIGVLFDSGAGTPIKRHAYQQNKINNSLSTILNKLETIYLVLSHLDSDHYRLLHWDEHLLGKITCVFIPIYENWLDVKDIKFKAETIGVNSLYITGDNLRVQVMKTQPKTSLNNRNNKALVCVMEIDSDLMLIPGDYSYKMMKFDNDKRINGLTRLRYDFLTVPHHGDYESHYNIPNVNNNSSVAFFSAGNHAGYKHPAGISLDKHADKGYKNLLYGNSGNITIEYPCENKNPLSE